MESELPNAQMDSVTRQSKKRLRRISIELGAKGSDVDVDATNVENDNVIDLPPRKKLRTIAIQTDWSFEVRSSSAVTFKRSTPLLTGHTTNLLDPDATTTTTTLIDRPAASKIITPSPSTFFEDVSDLNTVSILNAKLLNTPETDSREATVGLDVDRIMENDETMSPVNTTFSSKTRSGVSSKAGEEDLSRYSLPIIFQSQIFSNVHSGYRKLKRKLASTRWPEYPLDDSSKAYPSQFGKNKGLENALFTSSFLLKDALLLVGIICSVFITCQILDIFWNPDYTSNILHLPECIYVTGGGFSGFWFSLGRLHSLGSKEEMVSQRFACYSAGCLGVVSVYANHSMPELHRMASSLQQDWKDGKLNRYHVVEDFVDQILEGQDFDDDILNSLYILTSVPTASVTVSTPSSFSGSELTNSSSLGLFRAAMRQPRSMDDLRLMLRQSAFIPLATGHAYTLQGHLDGGFSAGQHPTCMTRVGLANDWNLLTNTLNVNLSPERVHEFWNLGLEYGI